MAARKSRSRSSARSKSAPRRKAAAKRASSRTARKRTAVKRTPKRATERATKRATKRAPKRATRRAPKRAAKRPAPKRPQSRRPASRPATAARATTSAPNAIGLIAQHLDFTSHDLDGVRRFYTDLLGFSKFDHDARFDYLSVSIAPQVTIGFMPPMPGPPEQWRPPREPGLYFVVANVDRAFATLTQKGVTFDQPPTDMAWGDRVAMLRDPEGRMVWIAQRLGKG